MVEDGAIWANSSMAETVPKKGRPKDGEDGLGQAVGKGREEEGLGYVATTLVVWARLNTSSRIKGVVLRTEGARIGNEEKGNSL